MASEGALHLNNSNFLQIHTKYYNELLESQEMSDVTLACDGHEIGAHKTIISASSLFFREVIQKSKHPNPYIYLKGISKETLESILKFIYNGEVTARSANLENLVDAGNELKIEGLMEERSKTNEKRKFSTKKEENVVTSKPKEINISDFNIADFVKIEQYEILEHEEETDDKRGDIVIGDSNKSVSRSDNKEEQEGEIDDNNKTVGRSNNKEELAGEVAKRMVAIFDEHSVKQYECTVCHKKQKEKFKMKMHVETHLEGFCHTCEFCGMVKKTTRALQLHVYNQHTSSKSGKADVTA